MNKKEKGLSQKQAEETVKKEAKKVTEKDLKNVLDKADELKETFEKEGPLGRFITDLKLMISIIKDYWNGNYKEIPFWSIAAIVAALLYVINPVDIIPDVIPVVGYLDDAAVVAACLIMVEQDLHNYKEWKIKNSKQ